MDFKAYAARLTKVAQKIPLQTSKLVQDVTQAAVEKLIEATPVDTGRAKLNWRVSISEPNMTPLYWPRPAKPPSPSVAHEMALESARATIALYRWPRTIHITNNLPYIEALNNGHSSQAPAGFVEEALQAGRERISGSDRVRIIED